MEGIVEQNEYSIQNNTTKLPIIIMGKYIKFLKALYLVNKGRDIRNANIVGGNCFNGEVIKVFHIFNILFNDLLKMLFFIMKLTKPTVIGAPNIKMQFIAKNSDW